MCACGCGLALTGRQKKWATPECQKMVLREKRLNETYDITSEDYDNILSYQQGCCAICERPPKPGRSLAVDHEHLDGSVGPVRGLLCFFCNKRVLGARSTAILIKTAAYVSDPPAWKALGRVPIAPGRPKKKRRQPRKRSRKIN